MDKDTLTSREAEAWAAFRAEVDRLTPDQREQPDANADGWSMKDVLWHIAYWWDDFARQVEAGTLVEEDDDDEAATNRLNAEVLAASRAMSIEDVERGVVERRARMLAAWAAAPEPDDAAEKWFVWETIEHYEEHLEDARRFAAEVSGSS
jgi:uncharacterized damage-inducible protein DinB